MKELTQVELKAVAGGAGESNAFEVGSSRSYGGSALPNGGGPFTLPPLIYDDSVGYKPKTFPPVEER